MNKVEIDYDKLFAVIKRKKMTKREVSQKCGKSNAWLDNAKRQNSMQPEAMVDIIAFVLKCEPTEFIKMEEFKQKPADLDGAINDLVEEVLNLSERIDKLTEIVMTQQADIISILLGNDEQASAVAILNSLLSGNGKCKESVYRNACLKRKIPEEVMKKALENTGAHYFMMGSGQNGIRWITK